MVKLDLKQVATEKKIMKPSLLITGAGGFLGKYLLAGPAGSNYRRVYCLTRKRENVQPPQFTGSENTTNKTPPDSKIPGNITIIEGDLLDTASYEKILPEVDTVIHMAAATGKEKPREYFRVNNRR